MSKTPIDKKYVSPDDQFLKNFDKQHPQRSTSQQREISKHERIAKLRDDAQAVDSKNEIWSGF